MSPSRKPSLAMRAGLGLYGLAWRVAEPALKRNARLREGWAARVLSAGPPPKADLWVQAASGGEAYLAWELLRRLPRFLPEGSASPRVLATTFTSQGLGVLERARQALAGSAEILPTYFPFDAPGRMRRVLAAVRPAAVVLLETEIWPGLLAACRERGTPALVVNGRMTEKSLRGYLRLRGFWRAVAPARTLAVSTADAERFGRVFGEDRVGRMRNIKFDRLDFSAPAVARAAVAPRSGSASPFIVLGSVRREEEEDVLHIIRGLRDRLPDAVIGLFPRHMQRIEAWRKRLSEAGIPCVLRSRPAESPPVVSAPVILWDVFGELAAAFATATCCFLGGSLADLGGQNFLEPLEFGVTPVIGPSWSNFSWVGEEIFSAGLVRRAPDRLGVLNELCALAAAPPDRSAVRAEAAAYARSRQGGTDVACQAVAERLISG